jgi:hypothetical protein
MDNNLKTHSHLPKPLVKYLFWILWNVLGFTSALPVDILILIVLGYILRFVLPQPPSATLNNLIISLSSVLHGINIGLTIALCQGISLGLRKANLPYWLLANTFTWTVFLGIATSTSSGAYFPYTWYGVLFRGIGMGFLIGLPQGFLMQRENPNSWWWILASTLGSISGFVLVAPLAMMFFRAQGEKAVIALILIPLFGFISSTISGLFLLKPIRWFDPQKTA